MFSRTQITFVLALLPASWAAPDTPASKKHWHGWQNVQKFFPLLATADKKKVLSFCADGEIVEILIRRLSLI
jgi:hypothetical protein